MKKSIIVALLVLLPVSLMGTGDEYAPEKRKHGFYFTCPSLIYTQINNTPSIGLGMSAGWIFNHSFSLGLGGNLFFSNIQANPPDTENYGMSYFGVMAQYSFSSKDSIHVNLSTLIGGGLIGPWQTCDCCCNGYSSSRFITAENADGLYVVEPGIDLLMGVSRIIRIGAGMRYRFVSDVDRYGFSNSDLSGFSLSLIFQVGLF
jgi:hypothetical protein